MKNRTTTQTTGPDKRNKRTTTNTTPGVNLNKRTPTPEVKNPAVSAMEMRSIMESAMREGAMKGGIQGMIQDYNNIPFKNNAIDVLKRLRDLLLVAEWLRQKDTTCLAEEVEWRELDTTKKASLSKE